jgi:release factor glutamine methyltransferase
LKLKTKNIKSAQLEAGLLLAHLLKKKEFLFTYPEKKLTTNQFNKYRALIKRRLNLEPIAYLTGHKEFYGLDFRVNKNVLIPRPETEMMVEETLKLITNNPQPTTIIDIGTGSGCIIIALAKELLNKELGIKDYEFFAVDNSEAALVVAQKNAKLHGVEKKIKLLKGNLLKPLIHNSKFIIPNS